MRLIPVSLVLLAGTLGFGEAPAHSARTEPGAPVVAPPVPQRIDDSLVKSFAGVLCMTRPSRDAIMGFSLATEIAEVAARSGQEVVKGQLLLRGDDAEDQALYRLQLVRTQTDVPVQRYRAAMEQAKLEYDRFTDIRSQGGASTFEVERSRLNYETARLDFENAKLQQSQEVIQLDRLKARIAKYRLEAPFDGQVDFVQVDVGQVVSENEKIVRVVNVDPLWIDVGASTEDALTLRLHEGDAAWVMLDVAGVPRLAQGKVIEVAPTANLGSRSRRVRVELPNPKGPSRLLAGDPAWVRFSEPAQGVVEQINASSKPQN